MNGKQAATLQAIFTVPVPATLVWTRIESLLVALGCETIEGKGSAVSFAKDGLVARFHRPHPGKEAKRYQVTDAREFLLKLGVQP